MAKKHRVTGFFKSMFNVRLWTGYDRIKDQGSQIKDEYQRMFTVKEAGHEENLEEVMQRFQLSESDLQDRMRDFYRLSMMMLVMFVPVFCYFVYMLISLHLHAAFLSLVVSFFPLVLAFRYHFWYYQLKQRRLGVTFKEWLRHGVLGER